MEISRLFIHEVLREMLLTPKPQRRIHLAAVLAPAPLEHLHGILAILYIDGQACDFFGLLRAARNTCPNKARTIRLIVAQERISLRLMEGTERLIRAGISLDDYLGFRRESRRISARP